VKVTVAELLGGIAVVISSSTSARRVVVVGIVVVMAVVRGVEHIRVPFVNSSSAVAELGGIAVVTTVVVPVLGEVVVVVIMAVVRGVEHIRVPFVNSSSAVAMETVGLAGGL